MTWINITSTWFINREFKDTLNPYTWYQLFTAPDYEYYKIIWTWQTTVGWSQNCSTSWGTSTITEQTYNNPEFDGRPVADGVSRNWATDEQTADAFCAEQWESFVSYAILPNNSNWNYTIRNYDNTQREQQWRASAFTEITCGQVTNTPWETTCTWWTWSVVETTQYVVNNKQIYQQLYDIKVILLYFFVFFVFFAFVKLLRPFISRFKN